MRFDARDHFKYDDEGNAIEIFPPLSKENNGDLFEIITEYGCRVTGRISFTSYGHECSYCPFKSYLVCKYLPCSRSIGFTPADSFLNSSNDMISKGDIRRNVCNSDVCMYYTDNCRRFELDSEGICLFKIIIS